MRVMTDKDQICKQEKNICTFTDENMHKCDMAAERNKARNILYIKLKCISYQ